MSTERLSRSTLHLKAGGTRESVLLYSVQSCNCVVLHRPLCVDSDKISEGTTSTYSIFSIPPHLPEPLGGTCLEDKGLNELGLEDVAKRDPVEKLEEGV
jgi:hypothetical protein